MKKVKNKKGVLLIVLIFVMVLIVVWIYCHSPLFYRYTIFTNDKSIAMRDDIVSYNKRKGKIELDECNIQFEFSGLDTLWDIEVKEETQLTFITDVNVQGEYKLVIVCPDQSILQLQCKAKQSIFLEKGSYKIRMVGVEAKGEIDIKIVNAESVEIIPFN